MQKFSNLESFLLNFLLGNETECLITGSTGSGKTSKVIETLNKFQSYFSKYYTQNNQSWRNPNNNSDLKTKLELNSKSLFFILTVPNNTQLLSIAEHYKHLSGIDYINKHVTNFKFYNQNFQVRNIESTCRKIVEFICNMFQILPYICVIYDECHLQEDPYGIVLKELLAIFKIKTVYISATMPESFNHIKIKYDVPKTDAINSRYTVSVRTDYIENSYAENCVIYSYLECLKNGNVLIVLKGINNQNTLKNKITSFCKDDKLSIPQIVILNSETVTTSLKMILDYSKASNIIIIATSVVDQGITLPKIKTIFDTQTYYKIIQYNPLGDYIMEIVKLNEAGIEQRKGRGGRTCDTDYYVLKDTTQYVCTYENKVNYTIGNLFTPLLFLKNEINKVMECIKYIQQKDKEKAYKKIYYDKDIFNRIYGKNKIFIDNYVTGVYCNATILTTKMVNELQMWSKDLSCKIESIINKFISNDETIKCLFTDENFVSIYNNANFKSTFARILYAKFSKKIKFISNKYLSDTFYNLISNCDILLDAKLSKAFKEQYKIDTDEMPSDITNYIKDINFSEITQFLKQITKINTQDRSLTKSEYLEKCLGHNVVQDEINVDDLNHFDVIKIINTKDISILSFVKI